VPNVELNPTDLPECPATNAIFIVEPYVVVVTQRTVVVDIIIGVGNSVRRPGWLKAIGTEPDHIALVHEYLDGTGLVQILGRAAP
jgi:hypothetical protein